MVRLITSIAVTITRKDIAYSLVIIWALAGISVNQVETPMISLLTKSSVVAISVVALVFLNLIMKRK